MAEQQHSTSTTAAQRRVHLEGQLQGYRACLEDFQNAQRAGTLPSSTAYVWRDEIARLERQLDQEQAIAENVAPAPGARAQRRESVAAIAAQLGIESHQLTPDVIYTLDQLEYAKCIAVSEGCGSGELPDRLRARVEEREQELRRLLDEQGQQPQQDDAESISSSWTAPSVWSLAHSNGWVRQAAERLRQHEQTTAGMILDRIAEEIPKTSARVYKDLTEEDSFTIVDTVTGKGLRAFVALQMLLEDLFVEPGQEPRDASHAAALQPPKYCVEVIDATDQLYEAHVLLAYLWKSLDRSPREGLELEADETAGLIGALDRARWLVHDARNSILGERPAAGGAE